MIVEEWMPVVGYEGLYSVSSHGRVRSEEKMVRCNSGMRKVRERILVFTKHTGGYSLVKICNGKTKIRSVHQLVAEAFLGDRPKGFHVCHNDGNPKNNFVFNLRYDTCKGNFSDKIRHGTSLHGVSMNAKHSEDLVRQIREASGSQSKIAAFFGVSQSYVSNVKRGKIRGAVS